ncbi:hypothetical protein CL629_00925 [bacterium]|nr:hypothetical protein [bacterium]|tara:strand:- start:660 stop:1406 length:747 start_codon:yes stop_codon:yes gene_type:complete
MKITGGISGPYFITFFSDTFTVRVNHRTKKRTRGQTIHHATNKRTALQRFLSQHPKLPIPKVLRILTQVASEPRYASILVLLAYITIWSETTSTELTLRVPLVFAIAIFGLLVIALRAFLKQTAKWHGAEHMAIAAYEKHGNVSIRKIAKQSPIDKHCGGRFALPMLLAFVLANISEKMLGVSAWISLLILIEGLFWLDSLIGLSNIPVFWKASELLQKHITTAYPDRKQLEAAHHGIQALIKAHQTI